MLRVCSLGSGSSGNALVVEACEGTTITRVLIDNGFNPRQLERRLQRAGLTLASLDAVFVTHEHSDHVGGVAALARRRRIDVYCTDGTAVAARFADHGVAWRAAYSSRSAIQALSPVANSRQMSGRRS